MSQLTLTVLRLAFLVLLWLFDLLQAHRVKFVGAVLRHRSKAAQAR